MPLAGLRPCAAGVAGGAFGLMLLATSSTIFASPCDAMRRALSADQAAKFSLSGLPCEAVPDVAVVGATALASVASAASAELSADDVTALVDRAASITAASAAGTPRIDRTHSALPRASQLGLYDAALPLAVVHDVPRSMPRPPAPRRVVVEPRRVGSPASALRALTLSPDVDAAARRHDIDPLLLHAIAHVESRHNAEAVSHAGALGVMQVMPATARRFGIGSATRLHDAPTNLDVSASYLKTLQRRFGNDLNLILAAYNAGEGAVERYGRRIPPYAETRRYVREVLARYGVLSQVSRSLATTPRPARPTL